MNLSSLSDQVLLERTSGLVKEERRVTLPVLWHLREIERRRLFAERGFDSLFTFCTRGLGYSEGAASRRILAMRLLKDCPELEEKILDGRVSLSVAAQIQRVAKKAVIPRGEQKEASGFEESNLTDWKSSLVNRVEGMSARDAEKVLLEFAPEEIGPERTRRVVWMRDHGKCSYQDSLTSQRCESRHLLEIDHVMPVACGGSNDIENLRLVCRAHNTMFATQVFGKKKMAAYLNQCTFELSAPVGP
jgi:hypothetical protein